ncbi:glutamine-hydrolyzing GMP synthase [Candidatus Gottesmanbacteria bacterium]|nr:glutamine-hydrolyzing GMP synthase [Candidatus Gottesmanbacteria bacterium]MBI3577355.1 glutamine-hydrolyzing GMP synthase [Candidatus Gottesmanbacteria bacterium]
MILLVDFGSQTAHLIGRRLRELGAEVSVVSPDKAFEKAKEFRPRGIVFSGGPASVYDQSAPTIDPKIFELGVPILAICYGMQLTAYLLGGKVKLGKVKEFGPATLTITGKTELFNSVSPHSRVWMSHGDEVIRPPQGFTFTGQTETISAGAMADNKRKIFCVQFHPEVEHTEHGNLFLKNFLVACNIKTQLKDIDTYSYEMLADIKETIGNNRAIAAVSGGLDSTVAATLVARAIGNNLVPIHIASGLMRPGTTENVISYFTKLGIKPIVLNKEKTFLTALKGITDPEQKRKIIGKLYIDFFEEQLKHVRGVGFLVQGTIYSDVIESKGTKHADTIKSHHNVGGLPKKMKLQLIEPLRELYTDQVRQLARRLRIPDHFISQQPHPGPGYAIRIVGAVSKERLDMVRAADQIVVEEMKKARWYEKVLHSFAVATGARSTAVRGDGRGFGEVIAIRCVVSKDRMTGTWAELPYDLLQRMSSRIVNGIPGVSRVVYDVTTKPPSTIEWE